MNNFLKKACQSSCEGIMLKTLDVHFAYSASKRCNSWLKVCCLVQNCPMFSCLLKAYALNFFSQVKRDYVEGLGDSLDLVPIGAWYGKLDGRFSP
jgi:DNA ligase 1